MDKITLHPGLLFHATLPSLTHLVLTDVVVAAPSPASASSLAEGLQTLAPTLTHLLPASPDIAAALDLSSFARLATLAVHTQFRPTLPLSPPLPRSSSPTPTTPTGASAPPQQPPLTVHLLTSPSTAPRPPHALLKKVALQLVFDFEAWAELDGCNIGNVSLPSRWVDLLPDSKLLQMIKHKVESVGETLVAREEEDAIC